jgi:hypothetical protein
VGGKNGKTTWRLWFRNRVAAEKDGTADSSIIGYTDGNFGVDEAGILYATKANISGTITATGGSIEGTL